MSGIVHEVTMETFESVVDSHELVVLDFWAAWCAPCQGFAPIFAAAAARNEGVYFGKVNTEQAKELAGAFCIRSIPTLMLFKNADLVFEKTGVLTPRELDELIAKWR